MPDVPFVAIALLLLAAFLVGGVAGYVARLYLMPARGSAAKRSAETPAEVLKEEEALAEEETTPEPEDAPGPQSEASRPELARASEEEGTAQREPPLLSEPRDGKGDDLKKIKGIGPKLEQGLNELGIYHFDQIAGWDEPAAAWVDAELGLHGRIGRDDWVGQARTLAAQRDE